MSLLRPGVIKQHKTTNASHVYMLCASARLVLIQWTNVSFVDLRADCPFYCDSLSSAEDPVVDVTTKSLLLSLLL